MGTNLFDEMEIHFDSEEFHAWLSQEMWRRNIHMDAGETAALARQLEHIYAQTYDIRYAELKARRFIPIDTSVDSGAEFYTYRQWNMFGMAQIIANYADDLPRVDALAKEFPAPIKSLGASYGFSIQDMRRAAMSNSQLENRRAKAARRAHEQAVDAIGALGNADAGLGGFLNNANVPIISPDNAPWSAATSLQIVADLNKLVNSIVTATLETFVPDTVLLDNASFQIINTQPMSSTGDSDKTILRWFLENNPYITNIDQWNKLNTAGVAAATRLVAYQRSEEVLALVIPQEFEQFPPQAKNLEFVVPTHSRIGGVRVQYPLAIAYMDGTGA
jgi:hypothetical protein